MPTKYKRGDIAYIVESNMAVREVEIVQISGDFAILQFTKGGGRIQLRLSRLFPTKEAAADTLPKRNPSRPDWL